jgi:two-component system chemotaxis response regulator CheB
MSIAATAPSPSPVRDQERIRVMVVDDAVVARAMVSRWTEAELDMQVVACLRGAPDAIAQLEAKDPDVVILDITMPEMDGITALPHLLKRKRDLVVLMVSTLTRRNAEISLQALALGAADYIPKPESDRELITTDSFRRELIEKVRVLGCRRKRVARRASLFDTTAREREQPWTDAPPLTGTAATPGDLLLRPFPPARPRVLLIGASTGGPQALNAVLGCIGKVIDHAPVLITQHMPPTFTTILAEHLARTSGRSAAEARDGETIRAGHIYVAPGGLHMRVARHGGEPVIGLDDGPPIHFCKPAVDPLFASAAAVWGPWVLALVLTGMGSDGARGAAQLAAAGGAIIVQDEASSVVWGMPGRVAQAGLASAVLPLDQIAPKVMRLFFGGGQ